MLLKQSVISAKAGIHLSGAAELPPNSSTGLGSGNVVLDLGAVTMDVDVAFSALNSNSTAAHIHSATTTPYSGTAMVATTSPTFPGFPTGVTSCHYQHHFDMTQASSYSSAFICAHGGTVESAFAALYSGMQGGRAYFNIQRLNMPRGEIRGCMRPLRVFLPLILRSMSHPSSAVALAHYNRQVEPVWVARRNGP